MTAIHWIALGLTAWAIFIIFIWAIVRGGSMGEDDPEEFEPRGYVDQDGESTLTAYHRDAWKHAAVKTHHAD